jgi:hypothetical protein
MTAVLSGMKNDNVAPQSCEDIKSVDPNKHMVIPVESKDYSETISWDYLTMRFLQFRTTSAMGAAWLASD